MERRNKEKISFTDVGIICSIIGIVSSIILIIMNLIDKESLIIGIVLLCSCSINLITIANQKMTTKNKKL